MKFKDPYPVQCPACGTSSALPVNDLMALTASCPHCGASFRERGLQMRQITDPISTHYFAILILMEVQDATGIEVSDELLESIGVPDELCLAHLVTAVSQAGSVETAQAEELVRAATRKAHPKAPADLDFSVRLVDAISPDRWQ